MMIRISLFVEQNPFKTDLELCNKVFGKRNHFGEKNPGGSQE